jgi:hypothetical protein
MAAPAWRSQNTYTGAAATSLSITTFPTGYQADDILLLVVRSDETYTINTPSGWTLIDQIANSGGTTGSSAAVFWKRTDGSESSFSVTISGGSGANIEATLHAISGCATSGNPIDALATTIDDDGVNHDVSLNDIDTSVDETLVFIVAVHGIIATNAQYGFVTGYTYPSNLTSTAKRSDNSSSLSSNTRGGGIATWSGAMLSSGNVGGNFECVIGRVSPGTNSRDLGFMFSLLPTTTFVDDDDAGSGSEGTARINVTGSDTGHGTEGNPSIKFNASDTASGAETQSVAVQITSSDTGHGTDNQSLTAATSGADTGHGADASGNIKLSASDTGSAAEGTPAIKFPSADTGHGTDNQEVSVLVNASDTASGTEAGTTSAVLADAETGLGTDDSFIDATLNDSDAGSGAADQVLDTTGTNPFSVDVIEVVESTFIDATLSTEDMAQGVEGSLIDAELNSSDTASGSETGVIVILDGDEASFLDTGSVTGEGFPDDDSGLFDEDEDLTVFVSSSDTFTATENASKFDPDFVPPPTIDLVMGPADIYVAPFGTDEPVSIEDLDPEWVSLGGTLGGVTLKMDREYDVPADFTQMVDASARRLKKRGMTATTSLAEPGLQNVLFAVNHGEITEGVGFNSYEPPAIDRATPLSYRSVIIDGWAPGDFHGEQKRRRIIMRKCIALDGTKIEYTAGKQTGLDVTWTVHRIDGITSPFKVIDEV